MRILRNAGTDRVVDAIKPGLVPGAKLDLLTSALSIFAFGALAQDIQKLERTRLVLPKSSDGLGVVGAEGDRPARNQLSTPWLARACAKWIRERVEVRASRGAIPQGAMVVRSADGAARRAVLGSTSFSTEGLGLAPSSGLSLIQAAETADESALLATWFDAQWEGLSSTSDAQTALLAALDSLAAPRAPFTIYALILHHLFSGSAQTLDEDHVVKSATGIRETVVWKKLFKFQRDGVIGALDKLNRYGGCIIADSVGLGKTFEALAIIKYFELRNDRVLVLCPKRLRDNWTIYKVNDRRNVLATDRFNYDVLNHTDLSRDDGMSGDIDLSHVNWGNYDLVVIDESHNFRNKQTPRAGGETRYDRLMRQIVKDGVKTRVLMLSATPVNNRLADLRNQIAFATEGNDSALVDYGISSIDATMACLAPKIAREDAELLALGIAEWHKALAAAGETSCVFRDSAFVDDVAKTNVAAILEQHGLTNVKSL